MNLYSLSGTRPAPLPFRITLPSGFTRTDPTTFTAEEIAAAGFIGPFEEPSYDPATQRLDWADGGYVVVELPPPPPPEPSPQWVPFSTALMTSPGVNQLLGAVLQQAPGLYGGLVVGLQQASQGDSRVFLSAWEAVESLALVTTAVRDSIYTLATDHYLPIATRFLPPAENVGQEHTTPDGQLWRVVQARDADGQFTSDDPATVTRESLEWQAVSAT